MLFLLPALGFFFFPPSLRRFSQTARCFSIHHPHPAIISWCTYLISSVTCFSKRSLLMPAPWEHNQVRPVGQKFQQGRVKLFFYESLKKQKTKQRLVSLRWTMWGGRGGGTETLTSQPDPGALGRDVSGCERTDGLHLRLGVHRDDAFVSMFLQSYLLCPEVCSCCLGEQTQQTNTPSARVLI